MQDAYVMRRFSQPFFDYPLPERTHEISRAVDIGHYGTKGCSLEASRYIVSELSLTELAQYFKDVTFPTPHLDSNVFRPAGRFG